MFSNALDEIGLVYKQQMFLWASSFLYLDNCVSHFELLPCLEDCVVANNGKACGVVRSALRSTVALPTSRAGCLQKYLVSPIVLLNGVAWFPFLAQGGPWYAAQCDQWWFLGVRRRLSKDYLILSWLNFEPWEISGVVRVLSFISQMTQAPFRLFSGSAAS